MSLSHLCADRSLVAIVVVVVVVVAATVPSTPSLPPPPPPPLVFFFFVIVLTRSFSRILAVLSRSHGRTAAADEGERRPLKSSWEPITRVTQGRSSRGLASASKILYKARAKLALERGSRCVSIKTEKYDGQLSPSFSSMYFVARFSCRFCH